MRLVFFDNTEAPAGVFLLILAVLDALEVVALLLASALLVLDSPPSWLRLTTSLALVPLIVFGLGRLWRCARGAVPSYLPASWVGPRPEEGDDPTTIARWKLAYTTGIVGRPTTRVRALGVFLFAGCSCADCRRETRPPGGFVESTLDGTTEALDWYVERLDQAAEDLDEDPDDIPATRDDDAGAG